MTPDGSPAPRHEGTDTGVRPGPVPAAAESVRHMLAVTARLEETCRADSAELGRLRDQRQRSMSEAERVARTSAERELATAHGLTDPTSQGSRLRAEMAKLRGVQPERGQPESPPASLSAAVAEWKRLLGPTAAGVKDFVAAWQAWDARILLRRAKDEPRAADSLWRAVDRLDQIHRAVPSLREAFIAAQVREAANAADRILAAETGRRTANQAALAGAVRQAITDVTAATGLAAASWTDPRWNTPVPVAAIERFIRLGDLAVPASGSLDVGAVPVLLPFPFTAGVAVGSDVASRDRAVGLLRAVILRLFAAVPPGGVQVKVFDPVAVGQSVAEFRHLSEYDAQLMDSKTWTSERDIERVLDELSDHLEMVISTYLRGQFATIDEYNEHAGEVAQPYRVIVVFDYPNGFSEQAARQLLSLIENGPRCGVYTILHYDWAAARREEQRYVPVDRLVHSMQIVKWGGTSRTSGTDVQLLMPGSPRTAAALWPDEAAPISFDSDGNPRTSYAALLTAVGERVRQSQARPPAVTLDTLLPVLSRSRAGVLPVFSPGAPPVTTDPATWWTASSAEVAVAPLGRSGAQGVTSMYFSSTDVAGGAIMVGLPRSGKTTSLHSVILTLSMLYPPDELELYLIDAKHGVEFKAYQTLPHARMVSVNSDREFSLAVLKSIEREIQRRAELMKAEGGGRANLTEYRQFTGGKLPRVVVIIDEFHELFEEPDRIGSDAFAAFSNIVRMGPFAGVHIVVASQTLSGMPAMDRPTLMLLPQRVAFMCNEYDAELVMGESNRAARFLSKIGEGLFNPARGEESRNQPFQGLYIPPDTRATLARALEAKAAAAGWPYRPRVFDGDMVVARPSRHAGDPWAAAPQRSRGLTIPLGEPFTLDSSEGVTLRRTRGANVLLLGDSGDDLADSAIRGALHSVIAAVREAAADVTVIDFVGDEETGHGLTVMDVAEALGASYTRSRGSGRALAELATEVAQRLTAENYRAPSRVLILFGLQRALSFTPPDSFASDQPEEPSLATLLAAIMRDGPDVGIHTVISADRGKTIELRLGPDLLSEMPLRVLGSGADQQDLASATGQYGEVPAPRTGQLLIADQTRGTAKRVRGYALLTAKTLPTPIQHGS